MASITTRGTAGGANRPNVAAMALGMVGARGVAPRLLVASLVTILLVIIFMVAVAVGLAVVTAGAKTRAAAVAVAMRFGARAATVEAPRERAAGVAAIVVSRA